MFEFLYAAFTIGFPVEINTYFHWEKLPEIYENPLNSSDFVFKVGS